MRIWLLLSIALVVHQTGAQATFGPDGVQLPSIKIIAIFNFLRKGWIKLMHSEPSKTATQKNYNSGISCLKNGTACEETRVVDMARLPNNALNKKILKRIKAQKSHTNSFNLKTNEAEEGRFNPMLFPSPALRNVLWVRFYYVFFFAILIFVIIFSAPYFFTGMILQELKEGSEALGEGGADMNMTYDDMDMTMNDTMNDTTTMENGMEECMEDMSNEEENDNDMNNKGIGQTKEVSQIYTKIQTTEISNMNRERERENLDEINTMMQLNGSDTSNDTQQTIGMNQWEESDDRNMAKMQRINEQGMEQQKTIGQMILMGTSHMSQINGRNKTKGFNHTTESEEMQQVIQEIDMRQKNSSQTIDEMNLVNHMQPNEMGLTKEHYTANIIGHRHRIKMQNNTAQNQTMQQIHYFNMVNGMRPTNGVRLSVEIDNNNKNEMLQMKEQHRIEPLHPLQKNNFIGASHVAQINSMSVTNDSDLNSSIEEMQQVSQENAMRQNNSPQTFGGMNEMNHMPHNETKLTKEPYRTNIIDQRRFEKPRNSASQNQTIQPLDAGLANGQYRGELIKQWRLIEHENSPKQMNPLNSHNNSESANPFQRQNNEIAQNVEFGQSRRTDHRIPKMKFFFLHRRYNREEDDLITREIDHYSGYGEMSGFPSMTYSSQFEYKRPNEGLSHIYSPQISVGSSPFKEARIDRFHNAPNSNRTRITNELRQSYNIRENKIVGQNFDLQTADNMLLNSGMDIYNIKQINDMKQIDDTNNGSRQATYMQQSNKKRKKKKRNKKLKCKEGKNSTRYEGDVERENDTTNLKERINGKKTGSGNRQSNVNDNITIIMNAKVQMKKAQRDNLTEHSNSTDKKNSTSSNEQIQGFTTAMNKIMNNTRQIYKSDKGQLITNASVHSSLYPLHNTSNTKESYIFYKTNGATNQREKAQLVGKEFIYNWSHMNTILQINNMRNTTANEQMLGTIPANDISDINNTRQIYKADEFQQNVNVLVNSSSNPLNNTSYTNGSSIINLTNVTSNQIEKTQLINTGFIYDWSHMDNILQINNIRNTTANEHMQGSIPANDIGGMNYTRQIYKTDKVYPNDNVFTNSSLYPLKNTSYTNESSIINKKNETNNQIKNAQLINTGFIYDWSHIDKILPISNIRNTNASEPHNL